MSRSYGLGGIGGGVYHSCCTDSLIDMDSHALLAIRFYNIFYYFNSTPILLLHKF